jgi:hypothetical protein
MRKALLASICMGSALLVTTIGGSQATAAGTFFPRNAIAGSEKAATFIDYRGYRHYPRYYNHRPHAYRYYAPRARYAGPAYYAPRRYYAPPAYYPAPAYYAPAVVYYPPPVVIYPPPVVYGGYAPSSTYAYQRGPSERYYNYDYNRQYSEDW